MQAINEKIKAIYGFDFPQDFFDFHDFLIQNDQIKKDIGDSMDFSFGEVFKIFDRKTSLDSFDPISNSRYYNDPPEFFTLVYGGTDGLHYGYYVDDPGKMPYPIAGYYARDAFQIHIAGHNLFHFLYQEIENSIESHEENKEYDPEEKEWYEKQIEKLKLVTKRLDQFCERYDLDKQAFYKRGLGYTRNTIAKTRDDMGIVMPKEQYIPLSSKDNFLALYNYQPTKSEVKAMMLEAEDLFNQGYIGATFKLGKDLWIYSEFQQESVDLLEKSYEALNRPTLIKLLDFRRNRSASKLEAYQKALAKPEEHTYLFLTYSNLDSIPEDIIQLKDHLISLRIGGNNLKDLPAAIGALDQLNFLSLAENHFEKIPESVYALQQLEHLDISNNPISFIDKKIIQLNSLKELIIGHKELVDFPKWICRIPNLSTLKITRSKLSNLPSNFNALLNLKHLDIETRSALDIQAKDLSSLTTLHTLIFKQTQNNSDEDLFNFPRPFATLKNLEELEINHNLINGSWEGLEQLKESLTSLRLSSYQMESYPKEIFQLKALKKLDISLTRVKVLPADILNLSQLEEIRFYGNQLEEIPLNLDQLPHLKKLQLDRNNLSDEIKNHLRKQFEGKIELNI